MQLSLEAIGKGNIHFSIIIPMFNREKEIGRAIKSCINQKFKHFEIIIVDDGSTDNSINEVKKILDPRIKLIKHKRNKGVCPARNTGIKHANGEWVIFLDSDDELVDGALDIIFEKTQKVSNDIDRIGFMYQWDNGSTSPNPKPVGQVLNYEGYIRWAETTRLSDFSNCIKLKTFDSVQLPTDRSYESLYHLDFSQKYKTQLIPEIVAIEHTDALNRASNLNKKELIKKALRDATDGANGIDLLLQKHGNSIKNYAPSLYKRFSKMRVLFHLLAGNRFKGINYGFNYLYFYPFSLSVWVILISGQLSPKFLAWVMATKRR